MRKLFAVVLSMAVASPVMALGQKERLVVPEYRDEGDGGIPFNTSCASNAWTLVVSSDSIRRAIVIQTAVGAAASVCLSTTTNSGDVCNDSTPGVDVSTGASITDYSGIAFTCRARSGTVNVKGYWTRDSGDNGSVNRPR